MDSDLKSDGKKNKVVEATSETGTTPTTNTLATVTASKHHIAMETKRSAGPDPDDETEVITYYCRVRSLWLVCVAGDRPPCALLQDGSHVTWPALRCPVVWA